MVQQTFRSRIRDVGDPRVKWELAPGPGYTEQDVIAGHPYGIQQKYPGYASPMRLASGLEAQYIAAEASANPGHTQLVLINAQRIANGQGAYTGATDAASVVTELYNQRAREFWLEGRKIGDLQRNPGCDDLQLPGVRLGVLQAGISERGYRVLHHRCRIRRLRRTRTSLTSPKGRKKSGGQGGPTHAFFCAVS